MLFEVLIPPVSKKI